MKLLIWTAAFATVVLGAVLSTEAPVAVRLVAILAASFPLGLWVAVRAPLVLYCAFGFVLGAIPFGVLPGFPLPLVLLLAVSIAVTAVIQLPSTGRVVTALEWWILGLIVASSVSLLTTMRTSVDLTEFAKWLIATSVLLSLLRLRREPLEVFGRWYVFGSVLAAVFGLGLLFFDRSGTGLSLLGFFGYGIEDGTNLRFVVGDGGNIVRLTGTYVDPNAGGLFLYVAVFLALILFTGVWRYALVGVLALALTLTLSRSALLSLGVAFLVFLLFQNMRFGGKFRWFSLVSVVGIVLLMIPTVQDRILESFGSNDRGTSARIEAINDYPKHMDGHWLFGLGWGRIEFRDGEVGISVNHVANAALLSIYRGGAVVGLFFCAVLIVGIVMSVRGLRQRVPEFGFIGAGFIGFTLIALQLDFPVVTIPPVTALFSVFLAFLPKSHDFPSTIDSDPIAEGNRLSQPIREVHP